MRAAAPDKNKIAPIEYSIGMRNATGSRRLTDQRICEANTIQRSRAPRSKRDPAPAIIMAGDGPRSAYADSRVRTKILWLTASLPALTVVLIFMSLSLAAAFCAATTNSENRGRKLQRVSSDEAAYNRPFPTSL